MKILCLTMILLATSVQARVFKCFKEHEPRVTLGEYKIYDATYMIAATSFSRPGRPRNRISPEMLAEIGEVLQLRQVARFDQFAGRESQHLHVYQGVARFKPGISRFTTIERTVERLEEIDAKYFGLFIECWPKIVSKDRSVDRFGSKIPLEMYLEKTFYQLR